MDALTRLKLTKLIDTQNKILPLPNTPLHLRYLDFLDSSTRGVGTMFRGFGKSTILHGVYTPTLSLETQEDESIVVVTNKGSKSKDFLANTSYALEGFMKLGFNVDKGKFWRSDRLQVVNEFGAKTTFSTLSPKQDIRGDTKEFERPTLILCDDLESTAPDAAINARTKSGREKIEQFFFADLLPSLDARRGRLIIVGTILHRDSLIAKLLRDPSFSHLVVPAINSEGKSNWSTRLPLSDEDANKLKEKLGQDKGIESLEAIKRRLYALNKPDTFEREYQCRATSEDSLLFKRSMFGYIENVLYEKKEPYVIKISDALNSGEIKVNFPKTIIHKGVEINPFEYERRIAIDPSSDGGDKTAFVVGVQWGRDLLIVDSFGTNKMSPFEKAKSLLKLVLEWKIPIFGMEKSGTLNEYFYIFKELLERHRKDFANLKAPIPEMVGLSTGGKSKNIRISQIEIPAREGRVFLNPKMPCCSDIEAELYNFDINIDNDEDDFIDALSYLLVMFNFVESVKKEVKIYGVGINQI